jgi:hypothetical protein
MNARVLIELLLFGKNLGQVVVKLLNELPCWVFPCNNFLAFSYSYQSFEHLLTRVAWDLLVRC